MKRLLLTYRRPSDDPTEPVRRALTPASFVLKFPPQSQTPTIVAVSELIDVRLIDDEEASANA